MSHLVPEPSDEPRLEGVRVVLVDDTPLVLDMVTEVLQVAGASVTAVDSAEAALTAMQAVPPDVLLSDISMPGKDGYWLIDQVRALPSERGGATPAIALSAHTGAAACARALQAGFQLFVAKPVGILGLVRAVAALNGRANGCSPSEGHDQIGGSHHGW